MNSRSKRILDMALNQNKWMDFEGTETAVELQQPFLFELPESTTYSLENYPSNQRAEDTELQQVITLETVNTDGDLTLALSHDILIQETENPYSLLLPTIDEKEMSICENNNITRPSEGPEEMEILMEAEAEGDSDDLSNEKVTNDYTNGSDYEQENSSVSSDDSEYDCNNRRVVPLKTLNENQDRYENENIDNDKSEGKLSKRKIRKVKKDSGKEYINTCGQVIPAKRIKPNPCQNKKCVNNCTKFTEDERQNIFNFFWGLKDSTKQKSYLSECISVGEVKRRRKSKNKKFRKFTHEYYVMKNNIKMKVCKQFLINTVSVTSRLLRTVISNKEETKFGEPDKRGHHKPANKTTNKQIEKLKEFINTMPLIPSHYCRSSTSKKYLPADVKSFNNLYRMYENSLNNQTDDIGVLKKSKFFQLVKKLYNIGIHVPKKDKCSKCERFKNLPENLKTADEEMEHNKHLEEKEAVKNIFLNEQTLAKENNTVLVASFDLQKVLSTPHGNSMTIGFSRKYAVYNFTIYETASRKGLCYLWGERDGKRGSNEICSNLLHYLTEVDQEGKYKTISLFCDNCSGQNKNRFMLLMLRHFLDKAKHIEKITITYLIVGHTYMPVDSMHAVIEKSIKHKIVQAPSEWPTILRNARINPEPYVVKKLSFSDFFDFKTIQAEKGSKIKISDIKRATLTKSEETITVEKSFLEQKEEKMYFKLKKGCELRVAYTSELPINKLKFENLIGLCKNLIIKPEYHLEYTSLKTNAAIPDQLDETDIEDDI